MFLLKETVNFVTSSWGSFIVRTGGKHEKFIEESTTLYACRLDFRALWLVDYEPKEGIIVSNQIVFNKPLITA